MLCDEITSALDATLQTPVPDLMEWLQRGRSTSYWFISHDLPVVARMSDKVLVLQQGRVRDLAPTADLQAGRGSTYADTMIAAFHANAREGAGR